MITGYAAKRLAIRLLQGPGSDLLEINRQLEQRGLPPYYLGGAGFNIDYRVANPPRYGGRWWPPGLALAQFYLYYLPPLEGREPTRADEIVIDIR